MTATVESRSRPGADPRIEQCQAWLDGQEAINPDSIDRGREAMELLVSLGMDDEGVIAGYLYCSISDAGLTGSEQSGSPDIANCPGANKQVIGLYDGVSRLSELSALSRITDRKVDPEVNEDNLRKMLITMVDDVRVVLIKLVDQLIRLRGARSSDRETQAALSQLTLDVFAPLANRLGIWQLKWELEDHALRYRDPEAYRQLAGYLSEKREVREEYIQRIIDTLLQAMQEAGLQAEIYGRPKHLYSIWKKMQTKGLSFENLWDIRAVRIVVDSVTDCYTALGAVHTRWRHLPGEFDDYIATPKVNGYRSIHTVVIGPEDKTVEVQIRTRKMHEDNELGVAAHWRYKERRSQESNIDNKVLWLRQLLEWKKELADSEVLADAFHETVESQRVYVFTPKGTVIDLPDGSTPIDFAYAIHSEVGHGTRGARVNGKMVPLGYQLKTGEQVEVQTTSKGSPSRDWLRQDLGYIKTQRARTRIQQWFKHKDYDHNVGEGRAMLERELERLGLTDLGYERIAEHTPYARSDDLLAALGARDYKLSKALLPFRRELERRSTPVVSRPRKATSGGDQFQVSGVGNLLTTMARCCQPVPGDRIVGYITTGRGVTIHTQHCHNIRNLSSDRQNRLIEVEWGGDQGSAFAVELEVSAYHRSGILHDITQVLKESKLNLLKVNMDVDEENLARVMLRIEVSGLKALSRTLAQLSKIRNVLEVKRITN